MVNLIKNGYQKVTGLITPENAEALAEILWTDIKHYPPKYDPDRGFVWQLYKSPCLKDLATKFHPIMEKVVGEPLKQTYWYTTIYTNNSYMVRHTDRDACEISLSLNLKSDCNWTLNLQDLQGKEHRLNTKAGDGIYYLGREVSHERELLMSKHQQIYIQSFFHWVRSNGEFACETE